MADWRGAVGDLGCEEDGGGGFGARDVGGVGDYVDCWAEWGECRHGVVGLLLLLLLLVMVLLLVVWGY